MNDNFFDIVFDIMINRDTYDCSQYEPKSNLCIKGEYNKDNINKKLVWKYSFIIANGAILLGCIYTFIFILIPIIKFRILQCSRQRERRYSAITERIGSNNISLMKERLTSDTICLSK